MQVEKPVLAHLGPCPLGDPAHLEALPSGGPAHLPTWRPRASGAPSAQAEGTQTHQPPHPQALTAHLSPHAACTLCSPACHAQATQARGMVSHTPHSQLASHTDPRAPLAGPAARARTEPRRVGGPQGRRSPEDVTVDAATTEAQVLKGTDTGALARGRRWGWQP